MPLATPEDTVVGTDRSLRCYHRILRTNRDKTYADLVCTVATEAIRVRVAVQTACTDQLTVPL